MLLRFTKMHGLGNDFVLLDLISQQIQLRPEQIRELADRRLGVGFDQMLTVEPPRDPDLDFLYRIYNADGSEAEQCGNGARCVMRFVRDRGLTTKARIDLETTTGKIACRLEKDGNITVDMGPPRVHPQHIPFLADCPQLQYELELQEQSLCPARQVSISAVSIGNPHAVLIVPDVDDAPVHALGPLIEHHPRFPNQVNVGFMQLIDRSRIRLRVFERGVGETLACGTGACAAVVAGRLLGHLEDTVEVELRGGKLTIGWPGSDASIMMTGPACRVYEGRMHI